MMVLVVLAALLVGVNLLVRKTGGDVPIYSVRFARPRARALSLLARHRLHCTGDHGDPIALVQAAARRQHVSPQLVLAVARVESSLVHTRISATGAMGLMQLMPATAASLGVDDPFDPSQNAEGGARYLAQLLKQYRGDVRRALSAYNAGMAHVPLRGELAVPLETVTYVRRVLAVQRRSTRKEAGSPAQRMSLPPPAPGSPPAPGRPPPP